MAGRHNAVLNLSNTPESVAILQSLLANSKGKGEGRIKCTITKHRLAKTSIMLGVAILSKKSPGMILKMIDTLAPVAKPGRKAEKTKMVRTEIVLECSSTQGLLDGVDRVWRAISGAVSHRRVTKAALVIGLDSLNKIDPRKVRQLVSKVCPVSRKYWDYELSLWL